VNLLIVGKGQGSWTMRGLQLGAALGARVTSTPTVADWHWAESIVLVKRAGWTYAPIARSCGVPVAWDALDFWRQPAENMVDESTALRLLRHALQTIQPTQCLGATAAMADAASGVYVPHHGRAGLIPTPARDVCRVVGYDGNAAYLDAWRPALEAACRARGWTFVINPPDLSAVDLLVALRGGPWDGWICRAWKSGVKLVNAICAGRPIITQASAAWHELAPAGSLVSSVADLDRALEAWTEADVRRQVADEAMARAPLYTVQAVAGAYRAAISTGTGVAA
jgi:hypothetical protein